MLTREQQEQIERLCAEGVTRPYSIAKRLGLLKEFVDEYIQNRSEPL